MIHPINHLPSVIKVGVQTESGVEEIGFDLSPWLTRWPDLTFAVWPTRPGERASYIAADTEMVGNVLYWYPNSTDTEKEGAGTVEVVGIGGGKCKTTGVIDTLVKKTSLDVTQKTPEPIKPWAEKILKAADAILNATPSETVILPETALEGSGPTWAVTTPWEQPFVAGQVYTVKYNGVAYECEAYEVEQGGIMLYLLGNLVAMGLGGNPDAPFMLAAVDNAIGAEMGSYGELEVTDFPASVTMGITASNAPAKAKQYTVIIDSDRSINSSVNFDTLAKMTDAEIQASVSVARLQDGDTYTSSVKQVNRYVQDGTVAVVQLQIGDLVDFSNEVYTSDITGYITFAEGFQPMMSTGYTQSLPHMTHWDNGTAYMRYNGERWEPVGIDQLKEDLGLTNEDTTTDVFYTADGEVFTDLNGAVMHVQKGEA